MVYLCHLQDRYCSCFRIIIIFPIFMGIDGVMYAGPYRRCSRRHCMWIFYNKRIKRIEKSRKIFRSRSYIKPRLLLFYHLHLIALLIFFSSSFSNCFSNISSYLLPLTGNATFLFFHDERYIALDK